MNVVSRTSYERALAPSLSVLAATLALVLAPVAQSSVFYVDNAADGACNRIADDPAVPGRYGSGSFANCGIASVAELLEESAGGNAGGSMVLNANGLFLNNRMELNGTLGLNGNRLLGLAAGTVAAGSTDGINGDQLASTNATVDALSAQLISIDDAAVDDAYIKVDGTVPSARSGTNSIAIGNAAATTSNSAIALGDETTAGLYSTAIGLRAKAPVQLGVAIGSEATLTGNRSIALGNEAAAFTQATAVGYAAKALSQDAIALGHGASVGASAANGVALGLNASVTANDGVAIGRDSKATEVRTVSVGDAVVQRRIVNMQAGNVTETSTDAVNGSQLFATNARVTTAEGNIATNTITIGNLDTRLGTAEANITTNTTTIGGLTTRVGASETNITNLTSVVDGLSSGSAGLVTFDDPSSTVKVAATKGGTVVDFAGDDGAGNPQARRLTSVAEGALAVDSTEAVNGSQLSATNERVTTAEGNITSIDGRVTTNTTNIGGLTTRVGTTETNITNLTSTVDGLSAGSAGLVTFDDPSSTVKVAATKGGTVVDFAGDDGAGNPQARRLTSVAEGTLASGSTEAVNGSQLFATNERVTTAEGSITSIDGRVTSNTTTIGGLTTRVGTAETNITNLTSVVDGLSSGSAGLVTFDDPSSTVKVAATKGGTVVDFAGDDGAGNPQARRLTSVALGALAVDSTEAVNGSQLFATNERVTTAEGNITSIDGRVTTNTTNIGGLTTRMGASETNITNLTSVVDGLSSGSAGLVTFDDPSSTVKVAATKGGVAVDFSNNAAASRKLVGVAEGTLASGSTEAVNGAQLFATNERVSTAESTITSIDGRVTSNTTTIGNLTTLVDGLSGGTAGLVTYDDPSGTVKVAAAKGGSVVDYAGVDAGGNAIARRLVNVSNGLAAADSVNVSQLSPLVDALGGGASLDAGSGVVVGPTYAVQGGSHATVGDALAALDSTVSGHAGQLIYLDTRLDDLAAGAAGLVTYDDASGRVIVGAAKGGEAVDFSGTDGARRLSGVANGIDDGDAVSMGQLRAAGAIDPVRGNLLTVLTYDDDSLARASLGGTDGTVIDNLADGRVALGSREAINGGQLQSLQDTLQAQLDGLDVRVGVVEQAMEDGSGNGGPLPPGSGAGSVVIGDGADASGERSVAIGEGAQSAGDAAVAIGAGASASGRDSVAIGNGSVADRDREYSVGAPGQERVVSNVAPGVRPTDAVNLQQLEQGLQDARDYTDVRVHELDRRLDRMGAITAAYAGMATNTAGLAGDNRVGAGVGAQNGRTALAVGYQRILGTRKNVSVSLGGAFSGSDQSVSAGAGFSW
jgi:autotransporter adhesin